MPKTWSEKLNTTKPIKRVLLEKAFGGIQPGEMMLVATPQLVADYISNIPKGEARSIAELRQALAQQHDCHGTCPLSTSIFIRIAAEAALEDFNAGHAVTAITPFWRVVEPGSKIAKRLSIDDAWIALQRATEGLAV